MKKYIEKNGGTIDISRKQSRMLSILIILLLQIIIGNLSNIIELSCSLVDITIEILSNYNDPLSILIDRPSF